MNIFIKLFIALLICLSGGIAAFSANTKTAEDSLPAIPAAKPAPQITTSSRRIINFGKFPANKEQRGSFEILNRGTAQLTIKKIRKTCGCSKAVLGSKIIAPGAKTALTAYIKANSIAGPFSKALYVESNDPKQRFLRLTLSGNSIALITIKPNKYRYMGTLTPGKKYEYVFLLATGRKDIKLQAKFSKKNFPATLALEKNAKGFLLKMSAEPVAENASLDAEISIDILAPEGWDPLKIKLRGRTAKN